MNSQESLCFIRREIRLEPPNICHYAMYTDLYYTFILFIMLVSACIIQINYLGLICACGILIHVYLSSQILTCIAFGIISFYVCMIILMSSAFKADSKLA